MNTKKEINKHLQIALKEIGTIKPWYEEDVKAWVFEHKNYPVSYAGSSPEEVINKFPLHLKEFIVARLADNLDPIVEGKTVGFGGKKKQKSFKN